MTISMLLDAYLRHEEMVAARDLAEYVCGFINGLDARAAANSPEWAVDNTQIKIGNVGDMTRIWRFYKRERPEPTGLELLTGIFNGLPIPAAVSTDWELCLLAISQTEHAFRRIDHSLQGDQSFCLEALRANPKCLQFMTAKMTSRRAFREYSAIDVRPSPDRIRAAFLGAVKTYKSAGPLSGRGHVARVTLNRRTAACIRGLELPSVYISGRGANNHYPESLVRKASEILGVKLDELTSL